MLKTNLFWSQCVLSGLAVMALSSWVAAQPSTDVRTYPPPGKLVDVGGWRLHINCMGDTNVSGPTVVMEIGAGGFSFDWSLVQPGVATFARVCSYDRAGSAWSDLGPRPRTMKQIAYELHTGLVNAGIKGPYVLVGQSIGGLYVRVFANQYPQEVAGMVLVDPSHEDALFGIKGKMQRMRETSEGRTIPPIQTTIAGTDKELSAEKREESRKFLKMMGPPKNNPPFDRFPADIQRARLWALSQPQRFAADDDSYWGEEFAEIYAKRKMQKYPLGDIPLIVLIAGKDGNAPPNVSADQWAQFNEEKRQLKLDLSTLSRNSKAVIDKKGGHGMHLDDPELLIDAIRQVVDAARHGTKLTESEPDK